MICQDCGQVLTDEERRYYELRCEACERVSHERVVAWRQGGADAELDRRFDTPPTTRH